MVIGNGLMARRFEEYARVNNIVIFASGVSNSNTAKLVEFQREEDLLRLILAEYKNELIVYFSSCDVVNNHLKHLKYYQHKLNLENIITKKSKNYIIFRLPQVVGRGGNDRNFLNYFVHNIRDQLKFEAYIDTKKNLLDLDDVYKICDYMLSNRIGVNQIINVVNKEYFYVTDIIKTIEDVFNIKAIVERQNVDLGWHYNSDISNEIIKASDVRFNQNYIREILLKYYL